MGRRGLHMGECGEGMPHGSPWAAQRARAVEASRARGMRAGEEGGTGKDRTLMMRADVVSQCSALCVLRDGTLPLGTAGLPMWMSRQDKVGLRGGCGHQIFLRAARSQWLSKRNVLKEEEKEIFVLSTQCSLEVAIGNYTTP